MRVAASNIATTRLGTVARRRQIPEPGRVRSAAARIRRRVQHDLLMPGLPRAKVIAAVVRLLDDTLIRIGTREYARANRSYGLTTLTRRHASVSGDRLRFRFRGKSGVAHDVTVRDRRIARWPSAAWRSPASNCSSTWTKPARPMASIRKRSMPI